MLIFVYLSTLHSLSPHFQCVREVKPSLHYSLSIIRRQPNSKWQPNNTTDNDKYNNNNANDNNNNNNSYETIEYWKKLRVVMRNLYLSFVMNAIRWKKSCSASKNVIEINNKKQVTHSKTNPRSGQCISNRSKRVRFKMKKSLSEYMRSQLIRNIQAY